MWLLPNKACHETLHRASLISVSSIYSARTRNSHSGSQKYTPTCHSIWRPTGTSTGSFLWCDWTHLCELLPSLGRKGVQLGFCPQLCPFCPSSLGADGHTWAREFPSIPQWILCQERPENSEVFWRGMWLPHSDLFEGLKTPLAWLKYRIHTFILMMLKGHHLFF